MKRILEKANTHKLIGKVFNRKTVSYVICGFLTTLVNFISYESLYRLGMPNLTANWMAWVIAVTFAYLVNKWGVFRSRSSSARDELVKIVKFYGARLVSLGVEQAGLLVFVEILGVYRWLVKGSLTVIVIVLNYLFSKLYIFDKKKSKRI